MNANTNITQLKTFKERSKFYEDKAIGLVTPLYAPKKEMRY